MGAEGYLKSDIGGFKVTSLPYAMIHRQKNYDFLSEGFQSWGKSTCDIG
jgi:hypothetical protein